MGAITPKNHPVTKHNSRIITRRKSRRKLAKANSTPGSTKCMACQATQLDRFLAKYSRAFRQMPDAYNNWCLRKRG